MTNTENNKKRKRSPATLAGLVLIFLMIVLFVSLAMFTSFDEVTNRMEAGRLDITLIEPKWDPKEGDEAEPNKDIPKDPAVRNDENTPAYVFLKVTVPYDDMTVESNYFGSIASNDTAGTKIETHSKVPYYKFEVKLDENNPDSAYEYDSGLGPEQRVYNSVWKLIDGPGDASHYNLENHLITVDDGTHKTYSYLYAYMSTNSPTEMQPLSPTLTTHRLFDKIHVTNFREVLDDNDPNTPKDFPTYARDYSVKVETFGIQANFLKPDNQTTSDPIEVWKILSNTN